MSVCCIPHDEHSAIGHLGCVSVVDGPGVGADQVNLQLGIPDQLARHVRRHLLIHIRRGFVDVISPNDQPFVPRADTADQTHADPAYIRAGLHDPVEH